ncbi:tRNA (guanine-N(1)-)-methyltransferase [Lysobacter xinjiangensis]|uniref:tRNA (guanine-N(1)-)-methyltransferase n=1 Tax=Cognatilysobacter xinjiangensis TaxID=546892 RepID=A0ABQ3BZQ0_9GAMM|nr:tRNA (guanosine(37)-N1)-methyltransferase TrmD [Lysobacter xinjiangensis]GGZ59245.1 tRNA (guanine-N(1)-)-methyltransferase [Lysobacter xinjiangensis]
MRIDVVSLFPEFVAQCAAFGVVGRAVERGLLSIHGTNPRDFAEGNYRRVDDRPFGGGPGMVMLIEPLRRALDAARRAGEGPSRVVYMSPQGRRLDQAGVRRLAAEPRLIVLCGRYEGVDERLIRAEVDEEVSIGDYVLSGGELPAAVLVDAIARLQDGVLNDTESAQQDSFEDGLLDCPHYTRPVEHDLGRVPDVLLSGDHARIARWRRMQSLGRTAARRPDLLDGRELSKADRELLQAYREEAAATAAGAGGTATAGPETG